MCFTCIVVIVLLIKPIAFLTFSLLLLSALLKLPIVMYDHRCRGGPGSSSTSGTWYPTFTLGQLGNLSYFIEMISYAGYPVHCILQVQSTALICAEN